MNAEPCNRRCPVGLRNLRNNRFQFRQTLGFGIPMGQHTPLKYVYEICGNCSPKILLFFCLFFPAVRMDHIA